MPADSGDPRLPERPEVDALFDDGAPPARVRDAWCAWLTALATDPEAALAAAVAYRELGSAARDAWLNAVEQDADRVAAPRFALFAPLLAVEDDAERCARILIASGAENELARPTRKKSALRGRKPDGDLIATITTPLYLDFVQVLACCYSSSGGIRWVKHDPITSEPAAPHAGEMMAGVRLEATPLPALIDELSVAIWAHERAGREIPEALRLHADLFVATESSEFLGPFA